MAITNVDSSSLGATGVFESGLLCVSPELNLLTTSLTAPVNSPDLDLFSGYRPDLVGDPVWRTGWALCKRVDRPVLVGYRKVPWRSALAGKRDVSMGDLGRLNPVLVSRVLAKGAYEGPG